MQFCTHCRRSCKEIRGTFPWHQDAPSGSPSHNLGLQTPFSTCQQYSLQTSNSNPLSSDHNRQSNETPLWAVRQQSHFSVVFGHQRRFSVFSASKGVATADRAAKFYELSLVRKTPYGRIPSGFSVARHSDFLSYPLSSPWHKRHWFLLLQPMSQVFAKGSSSKMPLLLLVRLSIAWPFSHSFT